MDLFFKLITKRSILVHFKEFFQKDSYESILILKNKVKFFVPNQLVEWRIKTFFEKEPETLEWIDGFNKEGLIFWDIGANIGLYSIYNALKNKNSTTFAFEPSTSNLRILTRNISINNLEKNIKVFPIPLTNKQNQFLIMNENDFIEGGAQNTFGEEYDFEGKKIDRKMKYQIFGTTINYLLDNNILEVPNHIKIDVDGIEHLILEGASKHLMDKKIKSLSIEINENFSEQHQNVLNIMKKNEFVLFHKKHNEEIFGKSKKYSKTFNYVFVR